MSFSERMEVKIADYVARTGRPRPVADEMMGLILATDPQDYGEYLAQQLMLAQTSQVIAYRQHVRRAGPVGADWLHAQKMAGWRIRVLMRAITFAEGGD